MRYDLEAVPEAVAYKLLTATTIPRPIAWVVTIGATGMNAAPYSFFNVMGSSPPTIALGLMAAPGRGFKDTALNILETGEFVVNLVPERLVGQMNLTAADAPRGVDELAMAGVQTLPSTHVAPPRIAQSPVSYECRALASVVTGPQQTVVIGRVLAIHIDDRFLLNPERGHVDTAALGLVARSGGSDYLRTQDSFRLERPTWSALVAEGRVTP
jgi:flavin reductase (DIM6/NTAB) family NADH-FMN oxidoreductase RutF